MRLFIAVCCRQRQRIKYRLWASGKKEAQPGVMAKQVDIEPGKQSTIGGDISEAEADGIISQLTRMGMANAADVSRLTAFTPYLYSKDKAVTAAQIEKGFQHNQGILAREGRIRREQAAVAAAAQIDSSEVKVSIEQVTDSDVGGPQINEGYDVNKANDPGPRAGRGGKRRNRGGRDASA